MMDTLLDRALRVTPRGSQTLSKRPAAIPFSGSHFAISGEGCRLTTADGCEYIDFIGGLGALALGHNHPAIVTSVWAQMRHGSIFSLPSILEVVVAERLVDVIPCAEQVRFVKTGSEACSAAVSIARAYTGHEMILVDDTGYHGWHDQFRVTAAVHPGVPDRLGRSIATFPYHDLDRIEDFLIAGDVAAVLMEPSRLVTPTAGYLETIKTLCHRYGALLIFDEMILGGRHALAGGQQLYDVTPDLATFGKAYGAGYPLAFVCGPSDIMAHAWPISGTFSGDAIALAACAAMLEVYAAEPIIEAIWSAGTVLQDAIAQVPGVRLEGMPPHFAITLTHQDQRIGMSVFTQECAKRGMLFHPGIVNVSAVMGDVIHRCAVDVVEVLRQITAAEPEELAARLEVSVYEDSVRR